MAIELTALDYCIILTSVWNDTHVLKNTFYYKSTGIGGDASTLASAFIADILPAWIDTITAATVLSDVYVFNLVEEADFFNADPATAGTRGTSDMPTFVGWYFRYFRPSRAVGNGRKTVGVISEGDVADGVATVTAEGFLQTLAGVLQTPVTGLFSTEWTPCIARTEEVPQEGDPTKMKRVPAELFPIERVEYVKVSSQNTRKR